jgi:hypothetical protein
MKEITMSRMNRFRENLLSAEPISVDRQQRFREELAQIVEPALPRSHRLYYLFTLACIAIGIPGALCGLLFDVNHRWIWGLNLLVLVPMATWILYILRRGSEPLRAMQSMSKAFVGFSTAAAVGLILIGIQNPSLVSVLWALLGMMIFLLTSSINIWNRVIAAERITREHILRVEYRIADLASQLDPQTRNPESSTPMT